MRPNTWILGLPSQVSSPTPLCPVKTDYCLLNLVVRGNFISQSGELRPGSQAEQQEVDFQLQLPAMSPWTSHLTYLGPIFLQNGHQSESHPEVVQSSHYPVEKPSWGAKQP